MRVVYGGRNDSCSTGRLESKEWKRRWVRTGIPERKKGIRGRKTDSGSEEIVRRV